MHRPERGADWVLVLAAYGVYTAAARLPSPAVAGLAVVLGLVEGAGSTMVTPVKGMLAVALFELAVRRPARESLAGAAAFALAVACGWIGEPPGTVPPALFRVVVFLTVLLLAGAYIRSARAAARAARERAAAEAHAARTAERTTIARELHDLVAHHVSSMVLRVGVARHVLPDSAPEVGKVLDELHATGTAALDDLSHLVAVLRDPATARGEPPPIEPDALPAALARVVERRRSAGMAAEASIDPAVARLDPVRGVTLLRLVQEGLANVAKHAGPDATVHLSARVGPGAVHLVIDDDGHGAPGDPGHGLSGMRERVDLLGGTFEAGPTGSGWRLAAELPLPVTARP
ncbi:two-component sensor histidine kinase [Actinomadura spongiicola]|uniref:histidine kinase n=2 Tax=Actinomadura spongiicola TaxID=2303421 RepID=A0A372G6R5_9ACTN|nr:two-component sensor histidine kinase [Actinomadura spongiicola]